MWTRWARRPHLLEDDLPIVLAFIAFAAIACAIPPETDTFFHLRTGQTIWESGSLPTTEPFSHTFHGRPWLNHEWLSQLVFYGLYALGGPFLLTIVCGSCALIAVLASWRLTRGASEVRLVLLLSLLILTPSEWAVRPQALSLALLMLAMWLVLRDRILWLPLLMIAWANAHGVVLFGVVVAGVNACEALIWSQRRLRALVVAALCAAAPMLSPLGWHYWPRVSQTISEARVLGIHEYRSAFVDASSIPFWVAFVALVVAAALQLRTLNEWKRSDRLLVLASGVIGVAAILSIRNAPSFILLAAPAISRLVHLRGARRRRPLQRGGYAIVAVAAAITIGVIGFRWRDAGASLGWRPISPEAMHAMRNCPGPIYNEYADGGTLIWFLPEHRVFVDGRLEAYPPDFLLRVKDADLSGRYREMFDQYAIRCAVTHTGSVLAQSLQDDSDMSLRFSDGDWSVFATSRQPHMAAF
jgi:hypothetical protein